MSAAARVVVLLVAGAMLAGCVSLMVGGPRDGRTSDQVAIDNRITSMVNERLMRDDVVRAHEVAVSTTRRVVTLRGTVYSDAARQRAVDLARDVPDVARVVSVELTVR